jgi:hypothetical protein
MTRPPLLSRLAWFIGLWLASVLALGLLAYVIRLAVVP